MADAALSGARELDRYVICDEIASGGMACVHAGRLHGAAGFTRTVAIKKLHAQYARDPDFVAMFIDEARLASRIHHPNVVSTLDAVSDGRDLLLIMEYVCGESLAQLVRQTRRDGLAVPLDIAVGVVVDALHGLHAAHEARGADGAPLGIVHRDVSPHNVLVGVDGVTRILDFGVAKAARRVQSTREGQVKGKLRYMAPEQIIGRGVDRRADVYSASVVLYELVTGRPLFEGDDIVVYGAVLEGAPPEAPSRLRAEVPAGLDDVVLRGLDRDVAKRHPTALQMADALEAAVRRAVPAKIGAWVESCAGAALHTRSRVIARTEHASSSPDEPEGGAQRGTAVSSAKCSPVVWTAAPTRTRQAVARRGADANPPVLVPVPGPARHWLTRPRSLLAAGALLISLTAAWSAGRATAGGHRTMLQAGLTSSITATLHAIAASEPEAPAATASAPSGEIAPPPSTSDARPAGETSGSPSVARPQVTRPARTPKTASRGPVDLLEHSE